MDMLEISSSKESKQSLPLVLSFDQISFTYKMRQQHSLRNFNLKMRSEEKIAIFSQNNTGTWRFALADSCIKFYEPQHGTIKLHNQDIKGLTKTEIRSKIATITSDPFVYEGTLRDNLDPHHLIKMDVVERVIGQIKTQLENVLAKSISADLTLQRQSEIYSRAEKFFDDKFFVEAKGSNLNDVEGLVIQMMRVILREPEVVLIDEKAIGNDSLISKKGDEVC